MTRVEDIESIFPSLGTNLRALNERAASLQNCQAMRMFRRTKEFIQLHPLISLFLAIFIVLAFLPFIIFAVFVSSSFILVFLSAIIVFGGTFAVAFASFLVVAFPILFFGGGVAVFVYLAYCAIVNTIQIVKCLSSMIKSFRFTRRVRRRSVRIDASQMEAQFPVEYGHAFVPATNEEFLGEETLNSQFSYLNY